MKIFSKIKSPRRSTRPSFTTSRLLLKTAVLRSSLQCSFIHDIYMMTSSQQQRYMAVHKASVEVALHHIHRANCRAQFHHSAFFTIASLDAMFFNCNTQSQYSVLCVYLRAQNFLFCLQRADLFCLQCTRIYLVCSAFYFVRCVTSCYNGGILPGKMCPLWASVEKECGFTDLCEHGYSF